MVKTAEEVYAALKAAGRKVSLINGRFIKPIDEDSVLKACENHKLIVAMEENVASGGYGEKVLECLNRNHKVLDFMHVHIPDAYVEHGNVDKLKCEIGIDADSITKRILERI